MTCKIVHVEPRSGTQVKGVRCHLRTVGGGAQIWEAETKFAMGGSVNSALCVASLPGWRSGSAEEGVKNLQESKSHGCRALASALGRDDREKQGF